MTNVTEKNFEEIISGDSPVLLDFWATWCGPCRMIAPEIEKLAEECEGKVFVGKVNVDDETGLAVKFGVAVIPTLLYFENGKLKDKLVGYAKKDEIKEKFGL